jgi:surface protein
MLSLLNTTFTNTLRQGSTLIGSLLSKLKARSTYFENKTCTKNTLKEFEAIPSVIIRPFITTWRTTTANETITVPTALGLTYNYDLYTSDGQVFTGLTGDATVTFPVAGDYDVSIKGVFPRITFNNGGDREKIIDIKQWGTIAWGSFQNAFSGCSNLVGTYTDAPDLTNAQVLTNMFKSCEVFTGEVSNWDVSSVTNISGTFRSCDVFNSDLSGWDVSNNTRLNSTFQAARLFNQDVGGWDVSNVTTAQLCFATNPVFDQDLSSWNIVNIANFSSFRNGSQGFSTANYDALLIGWNNTLVNFVNGGGTYTLTPTADFAASQYTGGGAAEAARDSLEAVFGWTITDSGAA